METIHLVKDEDNNRYVVYNSEINSKTNTITIKHYDDNGLSEIDFIKVNIIKTFLVDIYTKFVMREGEKDAYVIDKGFMCIYGLAYFYALTIIEKTSDYKLYKNNIVYTESGMMVTDLTKYSYHSNEPEFHYDEDILEYEVLKKIDVKKIIDEYTL